MNTWSHEGALLYSQLACIAYISGITWIASTSRHKDMTRCWEQEMSLLKKMLQFLLNSTHGAVSTPLSTGRGRPA